MTQNRSLPDATVIPVLSYPDVIEATDWLCRAFGLSDVAEFLRRVAFPDWDRLDVATSDLIEWRGGGSDRWRR